MKNLKELNERSCAWFLIEQNTIGNLRDEVDLQNAQYHSLQSVNFAIDIMKNIEGTVEEKIEFLLKTKEEIPKFKGKE